MCLSAYYFLVIFNTGSSGELQSKVGRIHISLLGLRYASRAVSKMVAKADSCWNIFFDFLPDIASKRCAQDWRTFCKERHYTMRKLYKLYRDFTDNQGSYIIANYKKMTLLILQSLSSTLFVSQPCSHFCIFQLEMLLFHLQNALYFSTTCGLSQSELVC